MLSDIEEITLQGANFEQGTNLPLFQSIQGKSKSALVKSTILYGRNGTGKSTISRAFNKLAGKKKIVFYLRQHGMHKEKKWF